MEVLAAFTASGNEIGVFAVLAEFRQRTSEELLAR